MKTKRIVVVLLLLVTVIALSGCGSSRRFGQRKAPRNCHSCTRWSK